MKSQEMKKHISLLFASLAAGLLVNTSQADIGSVDIWFVATVDSASGDVSVQSDLCMSAIVELNQQGFEFRSSSPVSVGGGQQGMLYTFTSFAPDAVNMVCTADRQDLFGPGGQGCPGGPGGPGGPGCPSGPL